VSNTAGLGGVGLSNTFFNSNTSTLAVGGIGGRLGNVISIPNAESNTGNGGIGATGGEGRGDSNGGNGGSGVVVLRYPGEYNINFSGLTGSTTVSGTDKITRITSGTGNVSWT
jgi:hypothetical protein